MFIKIKNNVHFVNKHYILDWADFVCEEGHMAGDTLHWWRTEDAMPLTSHSVVHAPQCMWIPSTLPSSRVNSPWASGAPVINLSAARCTRLSDRVFSSRWVCAAACRSPAGEQAAWLGGGIQLIRRQLLLDRGRRQGGRSPAVMS